MAAASPLVVLKTVDFMLGLLEARLFRGVVLIAVVSVGTQGKVVSGRTQEVVRGARCISVK